MSFCDIIVTLQNSLVIVPYRIQISGQINILVLLNPRILFTVPCAVLQLRKHYTAVGMIFTIREHPQRSLYRYLHFTRKHEVMEIQIKTYYRKFIVFATVNVKILIRKDFNLKNRMPYKVELKCKK